MKTALSNVRSLLKEKDLRLTPQREAVLQILIEGKDEHLTAERIYDRTRDQYPEIGLATIYRSLELFESLGLISGLDFGSGGRRYEVSLEKDKHYHHHLICLTCGEISEFNEDLLDDLEDVIGRDSGFQVVDHSLRFFGYCRSCQAKRQKEVGEDDQPRL